MPPPASRIRHERSAKRVRAYLGGHVVVDTDRPLLVWEISRYPAYYLPSADVVARLEPTGENSLLRTGDHADGYDVAVGDRRAAASARIPVTPATAALADHVRFTWSAMDAWFEEDEEVFVHPRDPYKRIDALRSTRRFMVELDGEVVADTHAAVVLHETGLIPRHYLAPTDVRRDLLEHSETVTHCPYKGTARYYHLYLGDQRFDDIAWEYPTPLPESAPIAGRICFDDLRVDVSIDGRRRPRPTSPSAVDLVGELAPHGG